MDFTKMLQDVGRPVWLAVMAMGFLWFWPVGVAVLAYLMWTGKVGNRGGGAPWSRAFWSSGNTAFDKYQDEARKALDAERDAFQAFLVEKLSAADQAEFNEFLAKRKAA